MTSKLDWKELSIIVEEKHKKSKLGMQNYVITNPTDTFEDVKENNF